MANNPGTNQADGYHLSSKDLEMILGAGANLSQMDLLQLDPALAQQLLSIKQTQTADPNLNAIASTSQPSTSRQAKPSKTFGRQPSRGGASNVNGPYVEITEQPRARGLRFRYECEGRSAGSIPGETSSPEKKTFPSIKIHNYNGPAVIVVSCVTKDEPYRPHPHNLVGKDCKKGVCTLRIRDTVTVSFPHLGIQCAKKKDVDGNLKMRQDINVDPYQTGFKHKGQNIDLNVVRLCFQVFLPDEHGKITRIVPPIVSQSIHDKKALNDLVICRIDRTSGKPKGGDEVFLLCEKINRDDVRVRFFEERDGQVLWEGFGDFGQNDVHRQFAIVFKTPPFRDQFLTQPVDVQMQLQRSSDLEGSEPIQFTYQPDDPDPDRINEKRKRKAANLSLLNEPGQPITQEALKQRLKLKASRPSNTRVKHEAAMPIKEEVASPILPTYSYTNTGSQKSGMDMAGAMATTGMMSNQYGMGQVSQMDVTATTNITTQNNMSGGNIQYTPVSSPQQPQQPQQQQQQQQAGQIPSLALNQQLLQLLAGAGIGTQQQQQQTGQLDPALQQVQQPNIQSNTLLQNQAPDQQQQLQQQDLMRLIQQALQNQQQGNQANPPQNMQNMNPLVDNQTVTDPSQQQNNQEMSLGSFDPNLLQSLFAGDSPMISFSSLDNLVGNSSNQDYDPNVGNVAGFETVGEDSNGQALQQQFDETTAAVQNLN